MGKEKEGGKESAVLMEGAAQVKHGGLRKHGMLGNIARPDPAGLPMPL